MGMSALLEFDRVTFAYAGSGVSALTDLCLRVSEGEGLALLGPNGAGKTTALRLAMALLHPSAGEARVMGQPTAGRMPEDLAGDAGFLFQQPEHQLFASSVREDVAFGPRQLGRSNVDDAVERALDQLELCDVAPTHPYDLPAPRRRLVALAGVLALRPRLLLLDEPTAGLDRHSRTLVRRALAAHRAAGGAVVAVSHDGEFVLEALDRALTLEHGRVVGDGSSAEALGQPGAPPAPAWARLVARLGAPPARWRFEPAVEFVATRCRVAPDA
jgi:energy-coupling factor transporter ATP-binding protein EcfA2